MDIRPEELDEFVVHILQQRRILNKIVMLCEGEPLSPDLRKSPSHYARLEKLPDSNFYSACIPQNWSQYRPQFFNCGSRNSVLNVYFRLLEMHNQNPELSFLEPSKLYAIIDCDIQKAHFSNYTFDNTEDIRNNLYNNNIEINLSKINSHRIFVTGLIHKEAYFILPEFENLFKNYKCTIEYKNQPLDLNNIYLDMIVDISIDKDLELAANFLIAKNRISFKNDIDVTNKDTLKDSFLSLFNSSTINSKIELIYLLLTFRKCKPYWEQITSNLWTGSKESFYDGLILEIGKYISKQDALRFHLVHIFNYLKTVK